MAHLCAELILVLLTLSLNEICSIETDQYSTCTVQGKFDSASLFEDGDIVLGGLFPIHFRVSSDFASFETEPKPSTCTDFSRRAFRWVQGMIFAIKEINKRQDFLPNVTLGYRIMDSCDHTATSLKSALILVNGHDETTSNNYSCAGAGRLSSPVIIGDAGSARSAAVLRTIGVFSVPLVSYFSSCSCLSDKREFPTFMRTIPSDTFQIKAIVKLVKHFKWNWVGAIGTNTDYARFALQLFAEEASRLNVCLAYTKLYNREFTEENILEVVDVIKRSSAKVILGFVGESELIPILNELKRQNITDIQWITSEAWSTATVLWREYQEMLIGSVGFAIRKAEIPGLKEFLTRLRIQDAYNFPLTAELWEEIFDCTLNGSLNTRPSSSRNPCTGSESLEKVNDTYVDVSQLRVTYNVYKAVYLIAHALHSIGSCVNGKKMCGDLQNVVPWQLLHYMKDVSFTVLEEEVSFDENGDPIASYDLVNWHAGSDGSVQFVKVGHYDASLGNENELVIDDSLIRWHGRQQIPKSVCSESCSPGSRKAPRKGEPNCCFDCIPCADGEISNQTDSINCITCAVEEWPNESKDKCLPKNVEFLSYHDVMGITLTVVSIFGACVTAAIAGVFLVFRNTPIVRANNMELSFLLLLFLALCFLCALAFIGEPTNGSCMTRHTVFGISFALCISCILGKTVVVLIAFRATLPGSNVMKWFGPIQQRASVFVCTAVQIVICIIWLTTSPPYTVQNTRYQSGKIILECAVGSVFGFWCVLGYIGFLACMCFVMAFLARKLPDNFNEAKFITFSMLIFFTVWITFIPAYVSTPGKYTVAVEVFAILASAFGLLLCIFAPKCYIILLKPEKNTKKHLMDRGKQNTK